LIFASRPQAFRQDSAEDEHTVTIEQPLPAGATPEKGKKYTFFVDDREFHVDEPTITGGEIMDLAGIARDVGIVLINEDGTQQSIAADEVIELKPGRRFKKAPRFKRG
jgi:hypothetical protein